MMKPARSISILYVSPLPPPQGGIASWTQTIVCRGLPVPYVHRIVNTSLSGNRRIFEPARFEWVEIARTFRIVGRLWRELVEERAALVHLNCSLSDRGVLRDWVCGWLVRLSRTPLVVNYRGDVGVFPLTGWMGLRRFFLKDLAEMANINLVLNEPSLQALRSLAPSAQVLKFPNFVEVNHSGPSTSRSTNKTLRAIYVGGLTPEKGLASTLAVARRLENVQFCLVGSPVERAKEIISALKELPNVTMTGPLPNPEVRKMLYTYDVFFFPSLYSEGFPISVAEAMSSGLPVVTTTVGALPEMIEDGKGGFVRHAEDIDGLVDVLLYLQEHPDVRIGMGTFNLHKAKSRYEYSVVIERLCNLYGSLLDCKAGSRSGILSCL